MAILRSIWRFIKLLVGLGLAVAVTMAAGVMAESATGSQDTAGVAAIVAGLVALWLFVIRPHPGSTGPTSRSTVAASASSSI